MFRYLDHVERQWRHRYFAFSAEYVGLIDKEKLRRSFEYLCIQYPMLTAELEQDNIGIRLSVPPEFDAEFLSFSERQFDIAAVLRYQQFRPRGLSRLLLVEGPESGHVALQVNHAVFDGAATSTMFRDLWQIYTDLVGGVLPTPTPRTILTHPPSMFMKGIWKETDEEVAQTILLRSEVHDDPDTGYTGQLPIQRISRLNRRDTADISIQARTLQTSVHAIVAGAIVIALRRRVPITDSVTMTCYTQIDIRDKVRPKIGSTDTALVSFMHRSEIDAAHDAELPAVARMIKRQVDIDVADRLASRRRRQAEIDYQLLTETRTIRPVEQIVRIGNAGKIPAFPTPNALRVIDLVLRSEVSVNPDLPSPHPDFTVSTYDGQMSINARFPSENFDNDDAAAIEADYLNLLSARVIR